MRGRIRRLAAHTTNGQFSPSIHSQSKFGTSGATAYFLKDGHGSTRALSDESGNLIPGEQYNYDAFGNRQSGTSNPATKYLYTGQQFDGQTGLYDLRARYYNPGDGRFLSQDKADYSYVEPEELNRYSYSKSNPINYSDKTGLNATEEYQGWLRNVGGESKLRANVQHLGKAAKELIDGPLLAIRSKYLLQPLKEIKVITAAGKETTLDKVTTLAIGHISKDGKLAEAIAINDSKYYDLAKNALEDAGVNPQKIFRSQGKHAEKAMHDWAVDHGYEVEAIGISNYGGPCPICKPIFDSTVGDPLFWITLFI